MPASTTPSQPVTQTALQEVLDPAAGALAELGGHVDQLTHRSVCLSVPATTVWFASHLPHMGKGAVEQCRVADKNIRAGTTHSRQYNMKHRALAQETSKVDNM